MNYDVSDCIQECQMGGFYFSGGTTGCGTVASTSWRVLIQTTTLSLMNE